MKITELKKIIKETLDEMAVQEMARTAGTGGAYKITPEGEEIVKQAKATNQIPEGLRANHLAILIFLLKAKQDGRRVQKIDYAKEKGVAQPAINPLFNQLEEKGLIAKEGYTSLFNKPSSSGPSRSQDISSMFADLDI